MGLAREFLEMSEATYTKLEYTIPSGAPTQSVNYIKAELGQLGGAKMQVTTNPDGTATFTGYVDPAYVERAKAIFDKYINKGGTE